MSENTGNYAAPIEVSLLAEVIVLLLYYSKKSHSYSAAINFYKASKADRDAVVKFLRSI